jgi:hypothetical protein
MGRVVVRVRGEQMRTKIVGLVLILGVIFAMIWATNAQASDPATRRLARRVTRLENQVSNLQGQVIAMRRDVNDLLYDVFTCGIIGDPLTTFSDGTTAWGYYYSTACVGTLSVNGVPANARQVQRAKP